MVGTGKKTMLKTAQGMPERNQSGADVKIRRLSENLPESGACEREDSQ